MDLNTVASFVRPASRAQIPEMCAGDAYLAGGTWLFSEPQRHLRRLIDLSGMGWPPLAAGPDGLEVAATCTLAALEAWEAPAAWPAAGIFGACCRTLLGSFKIASQATVGGNLCLALPAAPMAALMVALDAVCTIWEPGGTQRQVAASAFITAPGETCLRAGDILRSVTLPDAALRQAAALRQMSLTPLGRSACLVIGMRAPEAIVLTITAATTRPVRVAVPVSACRALVCAAIDDAVPAWLDDVHGAPAWRRRLAHVMAGEIVNLLAGA